MGLYKHDHPPLLAPGRHYMSLAAVEALCVHQFSGAAFECRSQLFYAFEGFLQLLLAAKIRCDVFCDGSYFTKKPEPDDLDVIVSIEHGVHASLSAEQMDLLDEINGNSTLAPGVDASALVTYPREHPYFGTALDLGNAGECYGIEHGQVWLKGYAVIRVWETDVRNRICR
jgi:hypothetical protein